MTMPPNQFKEIEKFAPMINLRPVAKQVKYDNKIFYNFLIFDTETNATGKSAGFFFPIASIGKLTALIILQFHLQPQFKYELFHIYFTPDGRYELNKFTPLPMCSFIAQLVECFFRLLLFN